MGVRVSMIQKSLVVLSHCDRDECAHWVLSKDLDPISLSNLSLDLTFQPGSQPFNSKLFDR